MSQQFSKIFSKLPQTPGGLGGVGGLLGLAALGYAVNASLFNVEGGFRAVKVIKPMATCAYWVSSTQYQVLSDSLEGSDASRLFSRCRALLAYYFQMCSRIIKNTIQLQLNINIVTIVLSHWWC